MEPVNAAVALSAARRHVLETLKRRGEGTADELAEEMEISTSAVRQHLAALRSAGYVTARQERGQPGRPADHFRTTELTEAMFVSASNNLSLELLTHIEEEDPELVGRIFERRRRRRVDEARDTLVGKTLKEKVALVAQILDAEGYLADFDELESGHYRINLHSCAIWSLAARYGQACATELQFLRDLMPEATVERLAHKTAGAQVCAYDICGRVR